MSTPQPRTRDGGGWCWIHRKLLWEFARHLGPIPTLTYVLLASHVSEPHQTAKVSFGRVATALGITRNQARHALQKLEHFGLISRITGNSKGPITYLLTDPTTWKIPNRTGTHTPQGAQSPHDNEKKQTPKEENARNGFHVSNITGPSAQKIPNQIGTHTPRGLCNSLVNGQNRAPQEDVTRRVCAIEGVANAQIQTPTATSSTRNLRAPSKPLPNEDRGAGRGRLTRTNEKYREVLQRNNSLLKKTPTFVGGNNSNHLPPLSERENKNNKQFTLRAHTLVRRTLGFNTDAAMAVEEVVARSLEVFGSGDEFLEFLERRAWAALDEGRLEIFENPLAAKAWIEQIVSDWWKGGSTWETGLPSS